MPSLLFLLGLWHAAYIPSNSCCLNLLGVNLDSLHHYCDVNFFTSLFQGLFKFLLQPSRRTQHATFLTCCNLQSHHTRAATSDPCPHELVGILEQILAYMIQFHIRCGTKWKDHYLWNAAR